MRAPCAPASSAASTQASSSADRDLEVVPQRRVPRGEDRPDRPRVGVPAQRGDHLQHPGVLGDDVPCPAQQDFALGSAVVEDGERRDVVDLAQQGDPEPRRRLLALPPAVAVPALGVVVRDARVDDEQRQPRGREVERHLLADAVAGVEEQRVPGGAQHRRRLVEDARRGTDEVVLRPRGPAPPRSGRRARGRPGRCSASATEQVERGRRRQAGPHRHVGVDQEAHAPGQPVAQTQRRRRPGSPPSRRGGRAPARRCRARRPARRPAARRTRPGRRRAGRPRHGCVCSIATGSTKPPL